MKVYREPSAEPTAGGDIGTLTKSVQDFIGNADNKFVKKEDLGALQKALGDVQHDIRVIKDRGEDTNNPGPFKNAQDFWMKAAQANQGDAEARALFFGENGYTAKLTAMEKAHKAPTGYYTGGTEGEMFILPEYAPGIRRTEPSLANPRTRATSFPMTGNILRIRSYVDKNHTSSVAAGVQVYKVGEGETTQQSKADWEFIEIKPQKWGGHYYATEELLQDAPAFAAAIPSLFELAFENKEEDLFLYGNGAGQPLGALNTANPSLVTVLRNTANTVKVQDIVNMYARIYMRNRSNYVWQASQDVIPQLLTLTLGDQPVYMPSVRSGQATDTLLGLPIVFTDSAEALGTQNDFALIDWSQYAIGDKGGVNQSVSIHVRFLQGEQVIRWVKRFDGQPLWRAALTPKKGQTRSPFIVLDNATA